MSFVDSTGLIAVHDAARALVSKELIHRCFEQASQNGNAVPVIPVNDSVRELNESGSRVIQRDKLVLVQTPQVFRAETLHKAYAQPGLVQYTDDAGLVESMGEEIHLTEGDPLNFKITFPHELKLAEALLSR
jgi:2-C-methyl-D-erythritol 4-phosphate cytidylyltransferase